MRGPFLLSLLAITPLLACSEYNFSGEDDINEGPDLRDSADGTNVDTDSPLDEECNGIDDNGNGEIDEGYPDTDGDGIKDCLDDDCDVTIGTPASVAQNEECLSPDIVIDDPWNVGIEWQWTAPTSSTGVIVMPAIGNITDDNGDGVINELDTPDIVFTSWNDNRLVALHGDGSGEIFALTGYNGNAGVAIADVDNDGAPEIVTVNTSGQIVALSAGGAVEWTSAAFGFQIYPQPVVADLEGDGDVEVVVDIAIVEGSSGATVTTLAGITTSYRTPVVADLDADGISEILLGENVYTPTGAIKWSTLRSGDTDFAAVADIDGDIGGESFWVSGSKMQIHDDDGTLIRSVDIPGGVRPGPPSVADFDGDGQVEIAASGSSQLHLFEIDGTIKWSMPIQDGSGAAGVSGYDINADGAYEVLYSDETHLRIFDGATGTLRYSNDSHSSGTVFEYPTVADVDGDGSAEIVIASNGSPWKGITVLGHNGGGWAASGATWPVHDFAVSNINADGSVPSPAPLSWEVYNLFRARPTVDDAAVDLAVAVTDVCFSGCTPESPAKVSVQVLNQGGLDSAAGIKVALYSLNGDRETLIGVQEVTEAIPAGTSSPGLLFDITNAEFGPAGIRVKVDDDGTGVGVQTECDESNNSADFNDFPC